MSDQGAGNRDRNGRRGRRPFGKAKRPEGQKPEGRPAEGRRAEERSAPNGSEGRRVSGPEPRKGADRNGDNRGRPDAGRQRAPQREVQIQVVIPSPPFPSPDCPLCGKPINDIPAALAERASKAPAHFDCVLASLVEQEKPSAKERVVYLGSGSFAVVEVNPQNQQKFTIIRKIQYEEKENKPEWRLGLNRAIVR